MKNEPAYPIEESTKNWGLQSRQHLGLTKREYFAGLAMQGLLSNSSVIKDNNGKLDNYGKTAVELADALLEALNESK